jgi:hypothetical protein
LDQNIQFAHSLQAQSRGCKHSQDIC